MENIIQKQTAGEISFQDSSTASFQTTPLAILLQHPVVVSALIAVVTLVTFIGVLENDFVMWDDDRMIYNNPNLAGLNLERLQWIFTHVDVTRRYTPLAALNYTITYQFCKLNPFGYHLSAWLFHAANAVLIFLILHKLLLLALYKGKQAPVNQKTRIIVAAALAALLWSLHPLRVAPVAWSAANFYPQALFFLLLSLLFYLRANEVADSTSSHYRRLAISITFFAFSLLSHPISIGFLVVPIVLDMYPIRRIGGASGWSSVAARRVLWEKLPFITVGLIVILVTLVIRLTHPAAINKPLPFSEFSLIERLMQAMYIWAYYVWRPWYPVNLSPVYTTLINFNPFSLLFVASGLAVAAAIIALVFLRRRWPLGLALGVCHLALLVPVLGLTEHPHSPSDRYSLIASLSWSILLAAWLANPKTRKFFRYLVLSLSIVAITALGMLSFKQTQVWNNSVTLFEHTLRILDDDDPYRCDIHWRLGVALGQKGDTTKAIEHFEQTLKIIPNHDEALYYMAMAYFESDKYDLATQYFNKFLRIDPDHYEANYYIAVAFSRQGKLDQAITHFKEALRINPNDVDAHGKLGVVLIKQGRADEAITHFKEALRISPDIALAHYNIAQILSNDGRTSEAITHFKQAVQLDPDLAGAHRNLGSIFLKQRDFDKAISHFRETLRLKPNWLGPMNNLAWTLAVHKEAEFHNPEEAIRLAERACELAKYEKAGLLDTLAVAYAAAGKFSDAVATAEKALELASSTEQKELIEEIQSRLCLYKVAKPYIEPLPKVSSD